MLRVTLDVPNMSAWIEVLAKTSAANLKIRHEMPCMYVQAQAYALGVSQQAAMYGAPVTAGDGGVLLDPQGAPLGAAPHVSLSIADMSCLICFTLLEGCLQRLLS